MWKLNKKGVMVLNKKIKVPKTVLFSTVNENKYEIVKDEMIYWDEAKLLNLKQTLEILKTF
jgi:hypothetical protein